MSAHTNHDKPLLGKIVLVAGATRGAGRGISIAFGELGATVWCTGRSVIGETPQGRPETIQETARRVSAAGGEGRWARVDHTQAGEVEALCERITRESGHLDVLVNDIWGGDALTGWGVPFWQHDLEDGLRLLDLAVRTHLVTARFAVPLLASRPGSLVVEVTDGVGEHYRGSLYYDLAKATTRRLAFAMAEELRPRGVTAVAVTPGFLRSEAVLDHFGVSEERWRDAVVTDPHFAASETPRFVGRGMAALAADPDKLALAGSVLSSGMLAERYQLVDVDGTRPHFGAYARALVVDALLQAIAAGTLELGSPEALLGSVGELAAPFVSQIQGPLVERLAALPSLDLAGLRAAVAATLKIG